MNASAEAESSIIRHIVGAVLSLAETQCQGELRPAQESARAMAANTANTMCGVNYRQLLAYLEANWPKTTLSEPVRAYPFERLQCLLAQFGRPELELECLGVTGSKGKGSIAKLVAEVLRAHGLRVGMFCSPHLVRVEERIELGGRPIEGERLARRFGTALEKQRAAGLDDLGITPLLLALALAYFRDEAVDVAVLEVRAGGRFDPTNVAPSRTVCVGPIGLEHVPGLGYSLEEIAWQKAGLVKSGASCFSARQRPPAERVLDRECAAVGATLYRVGGEIAYWVRQRSEQGQTIDLQTPGGLFVDLPLGLLGEHQAANAALAVSAAEAILGRRGRGLAAAALAGALCHVRWRGRLERLSEAPLVLYDGAHTADSADALARALAEHFPDCRWSFLVGVVSGKDTGGVLAGLRSVAARICCVPIPGFSSQPPEHLAAQARSLGLEADCRPSVAEALDHLTSFAEPICITGTLYLYAAAAEAL